MFYHREAFLVHDKALNECTLENDISFDFLLFIELLNRYYADEVDVTFADGPRRSIARTVLQRYADGFSIANPLDLRAGRCRGNDPLGTSRAGVAQ